SATSHEAMLAVMLTMNPLSPANRVEASAPGVDASKVPDDDTKSMVWEWYACIVRATVPVPDATPGLHESTPVESRSQMKWLTVAAPGSEDAGSPVQSLLAEGPPLPSVP